MLRDGRVGYIDFGIVGRVAPSMWAAVEALLGSAASGDFVTMARALCTLGVTATDVDIPVRPRRSRQAETPGGRSQPPVVRHMLAGRSPSWCGYVNRLAVVVEGSQLAQGESPQLGSPPP